MKPKRGVLLMMIAAAGILPLHAQDAPGQALPLRDVVLFSSGVGYFGRAGQINGTANVDLSFRAEQINDILKSLVILDPAGKVRPVTYTTKDPLSRQMNARGVRLDSSVTLGTLLRQFQGARMRLELTGEAVEGRLLSVSIKTVPVPSPVRQVDEAGNNVIRPPLNVMSQEIANLLTDAGLRSISLEQVARVKLLDDRLDRELRESLELLATGLNDEKRNVQLHFDGAGAREVRAGYLTETPVWKTSYRLVLDAKQKPLLQGWAIVENTSDEDWKDVHLSLISGRPISFIQDLYQPLYVSRPVVAAQVIGSPLPQTYGETLAADEAQAAARGPQGPVGMTAPAAPSAAAGFANSGNFAAGGFGGGRGGAEMAKARRAEIGLSAEQMQQSMAAQASGAERGDLFEYAIEQPVTLPRQQAAMVPIVSGPIEGEKISIYDVNSDTKRALNGVGLKNTTGLHLSGGPITVFQDGIYAGDGQINNVQPGEDRLISYAVDLDLVVSEESPTTSQQTLSFSAKGGVLNISIKERREELYKFRNKADAAKTVLVQENKDPNFALVEPAKPATETAEQYRFRVTVPPLKTAELKVVTERPIAQTIGLLDSDLNALVEITHNAKVSPKLQAALQTLVTMRRKVTDLQAQRARAEAEIAAIDQEQSRIRQNMAQLDRNSALYQQYVKKLTDQETRIETLRETISKLKDNEESAQKELRQYVDGLTVE